MSLLKSIDNIIAFKLFATSLQSTPLPYIFIRYFVSALEAPLESIKFLGNSVVKFPPFAPGLMTSSNVLLSLSANLPTSMPPEIVYLTGNVFPLNVRTSRLLNRSVELAPEVVACYGCGSNSCIAARRDHYNCLITSAVTVVLPLRSLQNQIS